MSKSHFTFTHAIVRGIPNSLKEEALRLDDSKENIVDLERAREDHDKYVSTLQSCGVEIVSLEVDEGCPDCVFVEDCCVVIGNVALITRPGHPNRRNEVGPMRKILKDTFQKTIVEVEDPEGIIDGGDVLFTGQEIFVGLTKRTNEKGIQALAKAFPEFPVVTIPVISDKLHLKSCITLAGEGLLIVGGSNASNKILQDVKDKAYGKYKYLSVEKDIAANVVFVNGHILHAAAGNQCVQLIKDTVKCPTHEMYNSELAKVDGALTCCSVLISA